MKPLRRSATHPIYGYPPHWLKQQELRMPIVCFSVSLWKPWIIRSIGGGAYHKTIEEIERTMSAGFIKLRSSFEQIPMANLDDEFIPKLGHDDCYESVSVTIITTLAIRLSTTADVDIWESVKGFLKKELDITNDFT